MIKLLFWSFLFSAIHASSQGQTRFDGYNLASNEDADLGFFSLKEYPKYKLRVKSNSKSNDMLDCEDPSVHQIAGYLTVEDDQHFFFYFFSSRSDPEHDPLILWLNGGPGCSSMTGLFMELGPCRVKGNTTVRNDYSWNSNANIIFLDQPLNVGFSYSESRNPSSTKMASEDVYAFLQLFLNKYGGFEKNLFYITGESYAGHYIPSMAYMIHSKNKEIENQEVNVQNLYINLRGIAIGNGLTDPLTQYEYYPAMACDTKYGPVLSNEECSAMARSFPTCAKLIKSCYSWKSPLSCVPASLYCNNAMYSSYTKKGLNPYDVRKKCEGANLCYPIIEEIDAYLNRPDVQDALNVDRAYTSCNMKINRDFLMGGDWMLPFQDFLKPLLDDGINILVYAGDADFICNWIGNKAWTMKLEWSGQEEFNKAQDKPWYNSAGEEVGEYKVHENFAFLRVYEAGHMVPYDQGSNALEMINTFIAHK